MLHQECSELYNLAAFLLYMGRRQVVYFHQRGIEGNQRLVVSELDSRILIHLSSNS